MPAFSYEEDGVFGVKARDSLCLSLLVSSRSSCLSFLRSAIVCKDTEYLVDKSLYAFEFLIK